MKPQSNPTNPFTILERQNQAIGGIYEVNERRVMDYETPKL